MFGKMLEERSKRRAIIVRFGKTLINFGIPEIKFLRFINSEMDQYGDKHWIGLSLIEIALGEVASDIEEVTDRS